MHKTTTLAVINPQTTDAAIARLAQGADAKQTHLTCLMIGLTPVLPISAYGVPPYGGMSIPDNWGVTWKEAQAAMIARAEQIKALLAQSGASGDVQGLISPIVDIKDIVASRAAVSDIACLADNLRDTPEVMREAAHGVLFRSPIGLMLNGAPSDKVEHVFIAWNSSAAAAKAVHVALPYLRAAKDVIVACFDPVFTAEKEGADPGTDVAAWLSHHGCSVTVSQFPTGGRDVALSILDRAREQGADLVVMGAYGHARLRQAMFGGTTRSMIEQTQMPVLMAH